MARLLLLLTLVAAAAARAQALPACSGPDLELVRRAAFAVCHSAPHKAPLWTAYRVDREQLSAAASATPARRRLRFRADRALTAPGAEDRDYVGSGFSRGHLAPAAEMRFSEPAPRGSYLLSNAIGQRISFNAGQWRALEEAVRVRIAQHGSATVYTGAIFCSESPRIGPGQVAVPCQLYKVVMFGEGEAVLAVVMPNGENPAQPWESFVTSLQAVEQQAGIAFRPSPPAQ